MQPLPKKEAPQDLRARLAALRNLPPLFAMVWQTAPALAFAAVALRLLAAVLPLAMLWVAKLIVDHVVLAVTGHSEPPTLLWRLLALEAGLAVVSDLLGRAIALADSLLGDRFTHHVSLRLMRHAASLDLVSFEDPVFYDKLERARRQTTSRLGMLASTASLLQQLITLATLSVSIGWFSPWFLPLLAVCLLPAFLGETRFAILAYSLLYRWTPERRELDYLRLLGASQNSAKEVKLFGLGAFLTARAQALFDRFYRENRSLAIRRATTGGLLNLLPTAGYYGAYAVILQRTLTGVLTVGDLTFLTAAFARSRSLIEQIFSTFSGIAEQAIFVEDLFDFFSTRPEVVSKPGALPAPRPIRDGFRFEEVSFAYPGSPSRPVLDRLSFCLEPGQRLALIGENGAGKTTLVKLMARLYDPSAGRILLDGNDLRDYSVEELRGEIGVIFQDYVRYDMPVSENIGLGRVEALGDQTRIENAARKAYAHELIERLPRRYQQMLGRRFDSGVELSAGQWQKLALARAYMRDAQLLILDEPTASLDARAEYEVYLRFSDLTQGRMAVLISHRFSTVRMADRILVLDAGRIIEHGSHEALLRQGGRYAELFELQAAGYR